MKYKLGEKVKYDGGDWWFHGTVSAVFEHPVYPCYRLNVERMEKKSCKFSVTQFEFDLEPYGEIDSDSNREWKISEIDDLKKDHEVLNLESIPESVPEKKQRKKRERKQETEPKNVQKPQQRKIGGIWTRNLELYRKGEKSTSIINWATYIRKQYKAGTLPEDKYEKLREINFPFEVEKKKKEDRWDRRLEEWKKGERKSVLVQQWKQRSIRRFVEGKLSGHRIDKLKEVGILK